MNCRILTFYLNNLFQKNKNLHAVFEILLRFTISVTTLPTLHISTPNITATITRKLRFINIKTMLSPLTNQWLPARFLIYLLFLKQQLMVSVIIPALNEGATIRKVIQRIRQSDPVMEIIVVDDNSSDNTVI